MSLADNLAIEVARPPVTRCVVCNWYNTLGKQDKSDFDEFAKSTAKGVIVNLFRACVASGLPRVSYSRFFAHMREHHGSR